MTTERDTEVLHDAPASGALGRPIRYSYGWGGAGRRKSDPDTDAAHPATTSDADGPRSMREAGRALRDGQVLAYPTEGVFGLGADPFNADAVAQIFTLKQRPATVGVLLIASRIEQVLPLIDLSSLDDAARVRLWAGVNATWPGPMTWVFPRAARVPDWVTGGHTGIALRVTAHAPAAALCDAFGGALVSTSANLHGEPPAHDRETLLRYFGTALDGIVEAPLGGQKGATPIRDAISGDWLRR
jgi:L-threonylcarbamoyladenylate synthase